MVSKATRGRRVDDLMAKEARRIGLGGGGGGFGGGGGGGGGGGFTAADDAGFIGMSIWKPFKADELAPSTCSSSQAAGGSTRPSTTDPQTRQSYNERPEQGSA